MIFLRAYSETFWPAFFAAERTLEYSASVRRRRMIVSRLSDAAFVGLPSFLIYLLSYEKSALSSLLFALADTAAK